VRSKDLGQEKIFSFFFIFKKEKSDIFFELSELERQ
jgi:hypothetical protein